MKSPALAINNCVLAGRSQESETDLEFASTCADLPRGGVFHVYRLATWRHGPGSTCTDVTRGGTQGSTCANFGISVQKIEEGDIYGLGSSVMSSILSNDAQTIILLPPCWRRKVTKPIRVLTYLF